MIVASDIGIDLSKELDDPCNIAAAAQHGLRFDVDFGTFINTDGTVVLIHENEIDCWK